MDLNFYSDLTDGTGQHGDPSFLDPQAFSGFDSVNKFPGGSDSYLTISGSGHPFLSSSETFHTPSLGDEEFEIPPISLDPDSALALSNVVSDHHGLGPAGHGGVVGGDDPSFSSAFVNAPPPQGLEHLGLGVMGQPGSTLGMDLGHTLGSQFSGSSPMAIDVPLSDMAHGLLGTGQLTTIDQSELSAHLGLGLGLGGGGGAMRGSRSPDHPLSATGSPTSSLQDDDMDDFRRSVLVESPVPLSILSLDSSLSGSPLPTPSSSATSGAAGRRGGGGGVGGGGAKKGRKKKDPNEPQKPVSAYALFFKDTQAAIKGQNPNATFGEVSKIVASMWDSLGEEQKQVYKRKNDIAKREYLKALAAYRANQMSQAPIEVLDPAPSPPPPAPPRPSRAQQYNPEENTITNICASNIILDLPQVSTRSRTGAIRPPAPSPPPPPPPPVIAKIVIKHTASGGVAIAAATAPPPSPRQPPPLQQMHGHAPPPPRLVHGHAPPPPLQAKPRGAAAPPPLQIKAAPSSNSSSLQADAGACPPLLVSSAGAADAPASPAPSPVVLEEGADVEEGMEVEVTVAPGPAVTPDPGPSRCVRAGCTNPAVESQDWDREYCSNECVATHCRDVFMAWCAIRGQNSTTVS